ncbi:MULTISPECIES: hypothetical protein [Streptomyces]|jgi:hypothetical protein|nr:MULTISPECIES: hypothetical protein [Streptomyces]GGV68660.1 hypothetical protein GCM10010261_62530 [Streptomyces pilosus]
MGRHRKKPEPSPPWWKRARWCFEIAVKIPVAVYYCDLIINKHLPWH